MVPKDGRIISMGDDYPDAAWGEYRRSVAD